METKYILAGFLGLGAIGAMMLLIGGPLFRTSVSAPLKDALADALASGNAGRIMNVVSRISSSVPAQVRTATAQ